MMGMMPSSPFSTAVPPRDERRSCHSLHDHRHQSETRSSHSLHEDRHSLSRSQSVHEPIAVGAKGSILSLVDRDVTALRSSSSANASSSYSTAFVSKPWPDPYWQGRPRLAEASRSSRSVSSSSSHAARLATLALCARDVIEEEEGEEESGRGRAATSTPRWKRFLRKLRPASSNSSGKQQLPMIAPSSSSSSSTFTSKGRGSTKRSSKAAACNGATASSSPPPLPSPAYKQDPKLPAPIASCPPLWERRHMPHLPPLDLTPSWQLPKRRRPLPYKWN